MNLVLNKKLLPSVPFQSTKYKKKELCVDNRVRETVGDVYFPTFRNEKCVYLSAKKTNSLLLLGGEGTLCFARKSSREYEKPSSFLMKFLTKKRLK